jgi:hypothetical protein
MPTHLPHLSKPQATVLALWSLGMVLARSCALTAISVWLATMLQRQENTVRQQLREWCYEAEAKRGDQRQALAVEACFVPMLQRILRTGQGTQLALTLDATTLGTRVTVLAISVDYRGCAIPVPWTILSATVPHAWRREWLRLLQLLRPAIPHRWTVIVLADRVWMTAGCFGGSCAWAGTRLCASIPAAPFGRSPRPPLAPWPVSSPSRARTGRALARPLSAHSDSCAARG